jgi:hypothetical protein
MKGMKKEDHGMQMMIGFRKLVKVLVSETKTKEQRRQTKELETHE